MNKIYLPLFVFIACNVALATNTSPGLEMRSIKLDESYLVYDPKNTPSPAKETFENLADRNLIYELNEKTHLIVEARRGRILIIENETNKIKATYNLKGNFRDYGNARTFFKLSPDKKYLVIDSLAEYSYVINTINFKLEGSFQTGTKPFNHLHFISNTIFIAMPSHSAFTGAQIVSKVDLLAGDGNKYTELSLSKYINDQYTVREKIDGRLIVNEGHRGVYTASSYAFDRNGNLLVGSHVRNDSEPVITKINPSTLEVIEELSVDGIESFRSVLNDDAGNLYFVSYSVEKHTLIIYDEFKKIIKSILLPKNSILLPVTHHGPQMHIKNKNLYLTLNVAQKSHDKELALLIAASKKSGVPITNVIRKPDLNDYIIELNP